MKIVDINPYFYPVLGGIEHRMHLIAKGLTERGHDVTIVTGQLPGTELEEDSADGYHIKRLPSKFIRIYNPPYISSKGLLETLNKIDADVVNFNYRWAPSYSKDMRRYAGKKVFTFHNMWGEGIGWQHIISNINDNMFRKTLNTFDHIMPVSDFVKNDLVKRGIDPGIMTVARPFLERAPGNSGREEDFILSVGRLVRTKGLDYLIESMRYIDTKLILCGKGPDAKRLKKKAEKFGVTDKIEFRGWISEEEKDDLMDRCKLFVMPSLYESYGFAAMEVMSYGKPLVSTNVDGLPDTVGNGGIQVPPREPKLFADAVNTLLSDDAKRRELGSNALKMVEDNSPSKILDIIEDTYRKVIEG